jgi:lysyl-tRNA synthetase class II
MGIDRLVMFLTNSLSESFDRVAYVYLTFELDIKEVLLFPAMKPEATAVPGTGRTGQIQA